MRPTRLHLHHHHGLLARKIIGVETVDHPSTGDGETACYSHGVTRRLSGMCVAAANGTPPYFLKRLEQGGMATPMKITLGPS